jgi:hypothetical protein
LQCQLAQHARHVTRAAGAIVFLLVGIPTPASDMPSPFAGPGTLNAGYRLYVRPAEVPSAPIDVRARAKTAVVSRPSTVSTSTIHLRDQRASRGRLRERSPTHHRLRAGHDDRRLDHDGLTDAEEDRN